MKNKKILAAALSLAMLMETVPSFAEQTPPQPPQGQMQGNPPEKPDGNPSEKPDGQPPEKPDGQPPENGAGAPPDGIGGPGGPGGMGGPGGQSAPESYDAVQSYDQDAGVSGETVESTGKDENAVLVTGGSVSLENCTVTRTSADSTGGDSSSFYGVGAAVLATDGSVTVTDSTITTDSAGGAGVFAYGSGTAAVSNTKIRTTQNTSGGIHVAGGGTLYAYDLDVATEGESAAAIRSDRGGGTMTVEGGSYVTSGVGSPAVYVTADISVKDADLIASGSEALCLEGFNTVRLTDCNLSGNMQDLETNSGNTWTVILYQSMSGDSEVGEGTFEMNGGTLIADNGGVFYTTNTESQFVLSNVNIVEADGCEYLLRCTGNDNQRGWGTSGANGADCHFTAISQKLDGNVIWDSISQLKLYLSEGSSLTGAVLQDESCAGEGGDGACAVMIDASSTWTVTADSRVSLLCSEGSIVDENGNPVSVVGTDGTVFVEGTSPVTVTADVYSEYYDSAEVGALTVQTPAETPAE